MANSYQAELLGASVFEQLVTQGQSAEDAHRAAQAAVTAAFGSSAPGPSSTGAVGSNDPAPGPKLPPPGQMYANLAAKSKGPNWSNWGSQPPPLPQAPPASWGIPASPTWTAPSPPPGTNWTWSNSGPSWDATNWWQSNNWNQGNWN